MTQLETTRTTTAVREAFTRPWAAWSGSILVLTAISQVIASRGDDDQETRDSWLTDTVFVVVATLLFAGIAYFFARRALKGDEQRQDRTVIGLGVFGAVMGVVGWFTAAPHAIALAAIFLARATGAMRANPYLVAGRKREDTAVMQAAPNLVVKYGAEALMCAADLETGLGVAVKVADGGDRAAPPALLRALELLGVLSASELRTLDRFARPWVTGGGRRVGRIETDLRLSAR